MVAQSAALEQPDAQELVYSDVRDTSVYHVDPRCRIGRWIPLESIHTYRDVDASLCSECLEPSGDTHSIVFAF
jgi:hypothetical protein